MQTMIKRLDTLLNSLKCFLNFEEKYFTEDSKEKVEKCHATYLLNVLSYKHEYGTRQMSYIMSDINTDV